MSELGKLVAELRRNYSSEELDINSVDPNPMKQFEAWFKEALAAKIPEPNAMSLATVGKDLKPSIRTVLLKGFDADGFVFFTNYDSRKGHQIQENANAALNFLWLELERQVRIEGTIEKISPAESDEYFVTRPEGSRLGAWASPQSQRISKEELIAREEEFRSHFHNNNIHRPPHWGGYRLKPELVEFWQGRPNRLHDRIEYVVSSHGWNIHRLAP